MGLLRQRDAILRREAAVALGRIGPQAAPALPSLEQALSDEPIVRQAAAEAIKRIRSRP
jgi:HEAT repeat protein